MAMQVSRMHGYYPCWFMHAQIQHKCKLYITSYLMPSPTCHWGGYRVKIHAFVLTNPYHNYLFITLSNLIHTHWIITNFISHYFELSHFILLIFYTIPAIYIYTCVHSKTSQTPGLKILLCSHLKILLKLGEITHNNSFQLCVD